MKSLEGYKKQELRRAALEHRESLSRTQVRSWGYLIQGRALRHSRYRSSTAIALYSPIGNEVPTHRIRDHALAKGRVVFYPKLGNAQGRLVAIKSAEDLVPGKYGILEPQGSCGLTEENCSGLVIFVPAVLVDKRGNRLGRGGGWYDRTLTLLGRKVTCIALAYECQLIEEVPTEKWDRPVDLIITEERVLQCERYAEIAPALASSGGGTSGR
jgi:5-formyltetrahydrofolate cyclo-ligase